jgi:hypothetical protein
MGDDDHPILGDAHVELERVDAHRERIGKGLQRVLGKERPPAAVGFDVEGHRGSVRGDAQKCGEDREARESHHD